MKHMNDFLINIFLENKTNMKITYANVKLNNRRNCFKIKEKMLL